MKKFICILFVLVLVFGLVACGGSGENSVETQSQDTINDAQYRIDIVAAFELIHDSMRYPIVANMFLLQAWEIADENRFGGPDWSLNLALDLVGDNEDYLAVLEQIKDDIVAVNELMDSIQNPPEAYTILYNSILDLYVLYIRFTEFALNPSGEFDSFNQTINAMIAEVNPLSIRIEAMLPAVE